jgi:hypothetical protein
MCRKKPKTPKNARRLPKRQISPNLAYKNAIWQRWWRGEGRLIRSALPDASDRKTPDSTLKKAPKK